MKKDRWCPVDKAFERTRDFEKARLPIGVLTDGSEYAEKDVDFYDPDDFDGKDIGSAIVDEMRRQNGDL